jgi:Tol biopolymer transport system component
LIAGTGINVAYNSSPHLSADERTMIFFGQLEAGAQNEIYLALRADPAASFGAPAPQTVLNGPTTNVDADLSANALTVFFASDRSGQNLIYSSTRATTTSAWAMPAAVTAVNAAVPYASYQPFVTADGQELWLASNRPNGSGQDDLYHAPASGSTFGAPVAEAELNTSSIERSPVLSADRKSIFWASDRTDGNAKGQFDIWFAQRASVGAPFTSIVNVAELNSTAVEYPGWLSADGCRLYMTRTGTTPSMYVATRPQ